MSGCNQKNSKAIDPNYICNPKTGRWVKITGTIGKSIVPKSTLIDPPIITISDSAVTQVSPIKKSKIQEVIKKKIPLIQKSKHTIIIKHEDVNIADQSLPTNQSLPVDQPLSVNKPVGLNFLKHESLYYSITDKINEKLAIFDLDGTLIQTLSGQKFSSSATDWKFAFPNVPEILKNYVSDGYSLVIISNQAGISGGQTSLETLIEKLKSIYLVLQLPMQIFFSTEKDSFRKPMTDIWDFLLKINSISPLMKLSFYCGDAAGRSKGYLLGKPKDFSITDRYFAYNAKLNFFIPEEIFLKTTSFSYVDIYETTLILDKYYPTDSFPIPHSLSETDKNLVIMVGPQASGKSSLSRSPMYSDYEYLNNDTIKNKKKLQSLFQSAIQKGSNIIVDNTNPEKETRKYYIEIARAKGYKIYCYFFDFPKILSFHLNQMRTQMSHNKIKPVPDIPIHTYYKKLQKPTTSEGFDDIIVITKLHLPISKSINIDDFNRYFYYKYDI